jgi:hypothetical protein
MAQNFPSIAASTELKDSLSPLLARDEAAASNFSGTAFPSTGLFVGMVCHRTDQNKRYVLIDLTPTWIEILQFDTVTGQAIAPFAARLATARSFSVTGDASTAAGVGFDGSADVALPITIVQASDTVAGKVELATNAETAAGADAARAVTPAGLKSVTDTLAPRASPTFTGTLSAPFVRATSTTAASLASTGHGFQVGPTGGANLIADPNDIQARNNGAAATLFLNQFGGGVSIGDASTAIAADGTILGNIRASLAEAQAGTAANKIMTPERVAQHFDARGPMRLRTTVDVSAQVAQVVFTNLASTFGSYILSLDTVVPSTNQVVLIMQTSTNNGSTFAQGSTDYFFVADAAGSTGGSGVNSGNRSDIPIAIQGVSSVTEYCGVTGTVQLFGAGRVQWFRANSDIQTTRGSDGALFTETNKGYRDAAAAVNAIRILFSSGNIKNGTIKLYEVP